MQNESLTKFNKHHICHYRKNVRLSLLKYRHVKLQNSYNEAVILISHENGLPVARTEEKSRLHTYRYIGTNVHNVHTYVPTYIQTYVDTYTTTHIHTYRHTHKKIAIFLGVKVILIFYTLTHEYINNIIIQYMSYV